MAFPPRPVTDLLKNFEGSLGVYDQYSAAYWAVVPLLEEKTVNAVAVERNIDPLVNLKVK
jgi:hypothetical protein